MTENEKEIDSFKKMWSIFADETNVKRVRFPLGEDENGNKMALVFKNRDGIKNTESDLYVTVGGKRKETTRKLRAHLCKHIWKNLK